MKRTSAKQDNATAVAEAKQSNISADAAKLNKKVRADLKSLHGWFIVALGFIQPILVKLLGPLLGSEAEILKQPWNEFYLTVLSQTAPMTIALAILFVGIAYYLMEPGGADPWGLFLLVAGGGALLLTVAARVSPLFGLPRIPMHDYVDLFFPLGAIINALVSYFVAYRAVLFISSAMLALYGAYAWFAHVRPTIARWRQPANQQA